MQQLLEIRNRPIQMEFKIEPARYEMKSPESSFEIKREKGSLEISTRPAKLQMDAFDMRASLGLVSVADSVKQYGERGVQMAHEATARIAEEGNRMMGAANAISDISFQRMQSDLETALGFSPSVPVNISVEPHNLEMKYQMDKLSFEWRTNQSPELEYVPGKCTYMITQYPGLEIKYIGRPIYVPPSADPEYEPSKFDVLA